MSSVNVDVCMPAVRINVSKQMYRMLYYAIIPNRKSAQDDFVDDAQMNKKASQNENCKILVFAPSCKDNLYT